MKISQALRLYREFGPEVALSAVCASSFKRAAPWKHRCILRYLKERYGEFISGYCRDWPKGDCPVSPESAPVWTMWWQGEENLPEVVRMCHASVNRHRGIHPFRILTQENYRDYVSLPEYIMDKVDSGAISITHLSDIIRFALLSRYGGLWLDSTVFVADAIPEDIFAREYYTVRRPLRQRTRNVARERWTGFLQAARKGCVLCRFVFDLLMEYWERHESLIDYFFIDYALELARGELPECRRLLESVPINNREVETLSALLGSPWDPEAFRDLTSGTLFFKLTWKRQFEAFSRGRETFYGHLTRDVSGS